MSGALDIVTIASSLASEISLRAFKLGVVIFFIIFVIGPIIFKFSYKVQRGILFLPFISYPAHLELSNPRKSGLYGTRHFFLKYNDPKRNREVSLGVWHVLPNQVVRRFAKQLDVEEPVLANLTVSEEGEKLARLNEEAFQGLEREFTSPLRDSEAQQSFFEAVLRKTKSPTILYLHGNTATRGATHRVEMYQLLRSLGFHVVAFDYRGYGDSSPLGQTLRSVVLDSKKVLHYVQEHSGDEVLVWGHSLGTAVASHLMAELQESDPLVGLVLESPFNNIREEIAEHPFALLFRKLPWFNLTISEALYKNFPLEADKCIKVIREPIMILHSEDDRVVPFDLGYKLYRTALEVRSPSLAPVEFHRFVKQHKYGHKHLYKAPNLPELVINFFNKNTYKSEVA